MSGIWLDLKFGARVLARNPVLTLVAALSLAIGVGANTTVFTIVKAVFLKPLPVEDPSRLVSIYRTLETQMAGAAGGFVQVSYANYEDVRDRTSGFETLAATTFGAFSVASGGEPEQIFGSYVTTNYFETLGLRPELGRFFSDEDERGFVVVLSHGLWTRRFGAAQDIVGQSIRVNGRPFIVAGVAPSGFKGIYTLANQEMWVPVGLLPQLSQGFIAQALEHRGLRFFNVVGRLRPSVAEEEAEAELRTVALALAEEHPEWNRDRGFAALPLNEATLDPNQRGVFVRAGVILMGAVGLVLAIACANVATLLLSRSRRRRSEIAMRLSLGASRGRVCRQLLTEAFMLAALGATLGALIALWCRPLLWRLRPPFLPEGSLDLGLDLSTLAFTGGIAMVAGVVFGTAPAWQAARFDLAGSVRARGAIDRGRSRFGQAIVVGQAALSLVALAAAGLFVKSLDNAYDIDPGFDHERLAVLSFDLGAQSYTPEEIRGRLERVLTSVPTLAGVENVALASAAPLSFTGSYRVLPLGAEGLVSEEGLYVANNSVTPGYFSAMGVATVQGRVFDEGEHSDARQVVIVNQTFAETFWPGESAVGRQVRWPAAETPWDVIGVVADMKYTTVGEAPMPFFFRPLAQEPSSAVTLIVRSASPPETVVASVLGILRGLEPEVPVTDAVALVEVLRRSLWAARLGAALLGAFGLLALALATVGIYGVLAHSVENRRRELGIRLALGAARTTILSQVVREGVTPVLIGLVAGTAICGLTLRYSTGMLYGVSAFEPGVIGGAAAVLALVALVACCLPAWRTTRIDPVTTLHTQ